MKIQDIFNLPKNRGGYKLFNRIMNRYGIPKDDAKELKNNIDNSSSGGGGNNIEYYTFNANNIPASWEDVIFMIFMSIPLYKYTYKPINERLEKYIAGNVTFIDHFNNKGSTYIIAIAYTPLYSNGFSFTKLKDIFIELGLDGDLDKVFTPITEEEFYDLNKWSLEDYK